MSKKDEAFELFSEGKTPDSPEVGALGLAKSSNKRYYRMWKEVQTPQIEAPKVEVKAPVVPRGVAVSSLAIGAKFELGGRRYRKLGVQGEKILCLHLTNLGWAGGVQKAFESSTRVIPK